MQFPETIVTPGLVDLHVQYRQPSSNESETIASGTRAALLGGYVLTCDMPNNPGGIKGEGLATCYGVPGIEFAAPLMFYQAKRDFISFDRLIDAMSTRPAEIIGISLSPKTKVEWEMRDYRIDEETNSVQSGALWTPYLGKLGIGIPRGLMIGGRLLIDSEENIIDSYPRVITSRGEEL